MRLEFWAADSESKFFCCNCCCCICCCWWCCKLVGSWCGCICCCCCCCCCISCWVNCELSKLLFVLFTPPTTEAALRWWLLLLLLFSCDNGFKFVLFKLLKWADRILAALWGFGLNWCEPIEELGDACLFKRLAFVRPPLARIWACNWLTMGCWDNEPCPPKWPSIMFACSCCCRGSRLRFLDWTMSGDGWDEYEEEEDEPPSLSNLI